MVGYRAPVPFDVAAGLKHAVLDQVCLWQQMAAAAAAAAAGKLSKGRSHRVRSAESTYLEVEAGEYTVEAHVERLVVGMHSLAAIVRAVDDRLFGDRDDGHGYNAEATIVHDGL